MNTYIREDAPGEELVQIHAEKRSAHVHDAQQQNTSTKSATNSTSIPVFTVPPLPQPNNRDASNTVDAHHRTIDLPT